MKKVYLLLGGGAVVASNPEEFLEKMMNISPFHSGTKQAYMTAVSDRCWLYDESIIRTTKADLFLQDLQANDFITAIKTN
jgi:hypothetical protein